MTWNLHIWLALKYSKEQNAITAETSIIGIHYATVSTSFERSHSEKQPNPVRNRQRQEHRDGR